MNSLKDTGSVARGYIGVQIQPVTSEIADSLGLKKAEGALVAEPQANGPAAKAGIESGDVITKIDGRKVTSNTDVEEHRCTLTVLVAYPQTGRDGTNQALDRAGEAIKKAAEIGRAHV